MPEAATKPTKEGPLLTDIVFVVNGKPTPPDKHPPAKNLGVASEKALKDTKNMGPLDQWVLTLGARELSFAKSFGEENVPSKSTMHLNPRKGKGGCVASA